MRLMRLFERRSSPENPSTNLANPAAWFIDWAKGGTTRSGATINHTTALNLSAVWAAVRVLTDAVASIPVVTYRRLPRGKERATDHPIYGLLHDRPNPEMSAFTFKEALQGHLATWGNAYAEIQRDGAGRPIALWPLLPDRTRAERFEGRKVYITKVEGSEIRLPADRVLHIPGFGFDGLMGYSPISFARESLGLTKAAEEFGSAWFGNGSRPSGILTHPNKVSDLAKKNMQTSWEELHRGLSNAQRVAILEEGVTWQAIGIPPEDAQFLETRKFQTSEVARWFKVPPHMIGDLERATFSNIEQQSIEFVTHTARPWVVRWEQVLNWDLFSERDRTQYFSEFLLDALLRGDSESRGKFFQSLFQIGALSPNDVLEKENMNPVEGGDRRFVPMNMVPLDSVDQIVAAQTAPKIAPAAQVDPEAERARIRTGFERVIKAVAEQMVSREVKAVGNALDRAATRGMPEFYAWLDEFYGGQPAFLERAYLPALLGLAEAVGGEPEAQTRGRVRALAESEAETAEGEIRAILRREPMEGQIDAIRALLARWETDRPTELASREVARDAVDLPRAA